MKVAIAYSTKDRVELTKRTIEPLLGPQPFDLWWFDGSKTDAGRALPSEYDGDVHAITHEIIGGSCRYIVYALTTLLKEGYDYIGLVENDVLLDKDWFKPTMELFECGWRKDFKVGSVSARTYEDRVLIQRDGYAVMHNLGAGCQIMTRRAAEIILQQYRTGMSSENRHVFAMLSGIDIAGYWAFRGSDHMLVADWTWERMLTTQGMCSLALIPAKAQQLEDIAAMGLKMADKPVAERMNDKAFDLFFERISGVEEDSWKLPETPNSFLYHDNMWTFFAHQLPMIGGKYMGDWRFKWSMGFGCFAWRAGEDQPTLEIPVAGPCHILVSGGAEGASAKIEDDRGFGGGELALNPEGEQGQVLQLFIPGHVAYRTVRVTALTPGMTIYGLRTRDPQPWYPGVKFTFNSLPPL